jgi:dTDP-4-amino-4,6-dideoxy-D-galactose acyltransferase
LDADEPMVRIIHCRAGFKPMKSSVKYLDWDSHFFHRRIARLQLTRLTESALHDALRFCQKEKIDCLYYLSRCDDPTSLQLVEKYRFNLVDVRATYELNLSEDISSNHKSLLPSRLNFRLATIKDEKALRRIAGSAHPESRFKIDRHFGKRAFSGFYAEWIAKSISGRFDECVWIAEVRGKVAGYVSCRRLSRTQGAIGLLGVSRLFRGQHVGYALVHQAKRWFRGRGIKTLRVVTQGQNILAQRLYVRCGFQPESLELWYHKWF